MDEKLKELANNRIKELIDELISYKEELIIDNGYCPYVYYKRKDYECNDESCKQCTYGFFKEMRRRYEKENLID